MEGVSGFQVQTKIGRPTAPDKILCYIVFRCKMGCDQFHVAARRTSCIIQLCAVSVVS